MIPILVRETSSSTMPASPHETTQRKLLDSLFLLARHCHAVLPFNKLLEDIIDCLLLIFGAERGFILLAGPDGRLSPAVSRRIDVSRQGDHSRTVVDRVMQTGRPMRVSDVGSHPDLSGVASVIGIKIRSVMAVPIGPAASLCGVVYLDSLVTHAVFTEADLELLCAAAQHVAAALENCREREQLHHQAARLREVVELEVRTVHDTHRIVGESAAMSRVLDAVSKVAGQLTSVLVRGESGTGKELIARAVHDMSSRGSAPFLAVNCMALSPQLLETELFGHEKGAFTGATERRVGRFELAHGGTIFLDEIGELDPRVQVKLLRVLQEGVIERVGSSHTRRIDVRLVCATHVDLEKAVARGKFREDLYYRIAVFPIFLPPLRTRVDDIPLLAEHFVRHFGERLGRPIPTLTRGAVQLLCRYRWPGNIRELRNVIERALVLESGDRLTEASFPLDLIDPDLAEAGLPRGILQGATLAEARDAFEQRYMLACLRSHGNNISRAARQLDIPRSTIYRKLDCWGLDPSHLDEQDRGDA